MVQDEIIAMTKNLNILIRTSELHIILENSMAHHSALRSPACCKAGGLSTREKPLIPLAAYPPLIHVRSFKEALRSQLTVDDTECRVYQSRDNSRDRSISI